MSEWKDTRLGDICTIVGRIGFRGYTAKDLVETPDKGAISLSPTNIANFELNLSKVTYISWEKYYESPEIMVAPGDIVFSKTGTVGWSALIKDVVHPITLNPQLVVFKDIKINPVYLSYVMRSHLFKGLVKNITGGSAVPTLTQKDLGNLEFPVADSETQEKIASILSSLDDKIAVNKKICENLEEQALALFKHWFVDFAPFKGGKFVECELGLIPEGWRVGKLGEIADVTMGQSPAGSSYNERGEGILFYQGRTEFGFRYPSVRLYTTEPKRFAEPLSTLLSVRAPVGDINVATEKCCIGRGLASIKSKLNCHSYIFYLLQSLNKRFDVYNGEGTVFGSINKDTLNGLKIIIPSNSIILEFEEIVGEMDKKIFESHQENLRLATLRDTLLPKLMSGQIKV